LWIKKKKKESMNGKLLPMFAIQPFGDGLPAQEKAP
jgi:hypothetical protein